MNRPLKISRVSGPPVSGAQEAAVSSVPANETAAPSIGANAATTASDRPTGEAGAPNLSTYRFRTEVCDNHDTATATSCEECDRGMVDSICCVCNRIVPLDDDGYCAKCLEPSEGLVFVERIAPGRIAL